MILTVLERIDSIYTGQNWRKGQTQLGFICLQSSPHVPKEGYIWRKLAKSCKATQKSLKHGETTCFLGVVSMPVDCIS